jgi:hypothetical protein
MLTRYPDQVHWKALTDEVRGDALLPGNVWLNRAKQTGFSPGASNEARQACETR